MQGSESTLFWFGLVPLMLLLLVLLVVQFIQDRQRREALQQHQREIETLKQTVKIGRAHV